MTDLKQIPGFSFNDAWARLAEELKTIRVMSIPLPAAGSGKISPQAADPGSDRLIKTIPQVAMQEMLSTLLNYVEESGMGHAEGYKEYKVELFSPDVRLDPASVLTVVADKVETPETHTIVILSLAQPERISSDSFPSANRPLGLAGVLLIDGSALPIKERETLLGIANKINGKQAGVTASVVTVSATEKRLVLESEGQGGPAMRVKNGPAGDLLEKLGIEELKAVPLGSGGKKGRARDVGSRIFAAGTRPVGPLLGLTFHKPSEVGIKGKTYPIDLMVDSLLTIRDRINRDAPEGTRAAVEKVTQKELTGYRLIFTNVGTEDLKDQNSTLELVGILTRAPKNVLIPGQNALLMVNDVPVGSPTNTISRILPGITLTLAGTTKGSAIELRVTYNDTAVVKKVLMLMENVNSLMSVAGEKAQVYTSPNTAQGPVFEASQQPVVVREAVAALLHFVLTENSTYTTPESVGLFAGKDGLFTVDSGLLKTALSSNREEVVNLLQNVTNSLNERIGLYIDPRLVVSPGVRRMKEEAVGRARKGMRKEEERLKKEKGTLEKRFNALELLLADSAGVKEWFVQRMPLDGMRLIGEPEDEELSPGDGDKRVSLPALYADRGGTEDESAARFTELTLSALDAQDVDECIRLLFDRKMLSDKLLREEILIDGENVRLCLESEERVTERLEAERRRLMKEVEQLSRNFKAVRVYSARFPFPYMPPFLSRA